MGGFNPLSAQMDNPTTQDVPGAPPPDPTQQLEQQTQSNIAAAHPQQQAPQQQADPGPPPQPPATPQPQGGLVKKFLTNFFSGAGDAMLHHVGLPTPEEQAQTEYKNKLLSYNSGQIAQLKQAQAEAAQARAEQSQGVMISPADAIQVPSLAPLVGTRAQPKDIMAAFTADARLKATAVQGQLNRDSHESIANNKPKASPFGKVDPIIAAQVGAPPDAAKYPGGQDDPAFAAASKEWGLKAETIKNRMASSSGAARGAAFNMTRPGAYVDTEGNLITATAGDAIKNNYTPAAPTFNVMSKHAQFSEMQGGMSSLRSAVQNLDRDFTPEQRAKLQLAMRTPDDGISKNIFDSVAGSGNLTDKQQDYVIALKQMDERILALRGVAGIGNSGSDSTRQAMIATLPNVKTPTKAYALKQLDAVENQMSRLLQGVAKLPHQNTGPNGDFGPANGKAEGTTGKMPDGTNVVVRGGRIVRQ